MARLFVDGNSEYLEISDAAVTGAPLTMACWFNLDTTGGNQTLLQVRHATIALGQYVITNKYGTLRFWARDGGGSIYAAATAGHSAGIWNHACGIEYTSDSRAIFLNGGNKGTDTNSKTVADISRTCIGGPTKSESVYMDGLLAECAMWNVALTDTEVAILAKGFSPLFVRPQNLVAYWPLIRDTDNDVVGGYSMTAYSSDSGPTIAAHPPVLYPAAKYIGISSGLPPYLGEIAFGEESPTQGETPEEWSTWSDGAGGTPTISGDPDWGQLYLACGEEGRSLIHDLSVATPRILTLTENRYGAGQGTATLQIRGQAGTFNQDDGEPPNWETYTAPITRSWRYIQVRENKP